MQHPSHKGDAAPDRKATAGRMCTMFDHGDPIEDENGGAP